MRTPGSDRYFTAVASGIVIRQPYFAVSFAIPVIRFALLVPSVSAAAPIIVIMVPIFAALWVKGTLTAMVESWDTTTWAKKRHPGWYRAIREQQKRPK